MHIYPSVGRANLTSHREECINLHPSIINFGKVRIGEKISIQITLTNQSEYEIQITPRSYNSQFYIPHRMIRLNGYQTRTIEVFFKPTDLQTSQSQIELEFKNKPICKNQISVTGSGIR